MHEQEIITLLQQAYACFQATDVDGYLLKLDSAKKEIDTLPERGTLYGEWVLVSALIDLYDLDAQCEKYREAARYLNGYSRVLPLHAELFGLYFNPFGICNLTPGHAEENAEKLRQAVQLFYPLTGGGKGTDLCYRAQLTFYQGELQHARQLAMEAFEVARQNEQGLTALCAADVLAQIAKHSCDKNLWNYAYSYIQDIADETHPANRQCREIAQVLYATLNLSLGLINALPDWIVSGDFGAISASWGYRLIGDKICAGTLPHALVTQIQYFLYQREPYGDPVRALNIIDAAQKIYGLTNLITNIYLDFLRAGCYLVLGDEINVRRSLTRALTQLTPDGLYLIVTEFAPGFRSYLYDIAQQIAPDGPARIQAIGENYWDKLVPFREALIRNAPQGFTRREAEVAVLIAAGKSNGEIAATLHISERTVEKHASNVFAKLHVNRRTHVAAAVKHGKGTETAFWV